MSEVRSYCEHTEDIMLRLDVLRGVEPQGQ
jgi:hypothetical protein